MASVGHRRVALIDMPLPRSLARAPWREVPAAAQVLKQLEALPATASVTAQPNLIPHLPRRLDMFSLEADETRELKGDYVLLAPVGDLWPLDDAAIQRRLTALTADPRFEPLTSGPLFLFRHR